MKAVGTGAGCQSLADVPNLARLFVGESATAASPVGFTGEAINYPGWGWED